MHTGLIRWCTGVVVIIVRHQRIKGVLRDRLGRSPPRARTRTAWVAITPFEICKVVVIVG